MQKKSSWKDTAKARLIILVVNIIALPSLSFMQKLGAFIGWCLWRFNGRLAKVSRINIQLCMPQLTERETEALVKKSLIETGKTAGEMGNVWVKPLNYSYKQVVTARGEKELKQAIAQGKGVIILAPHLGNWEIINAYISKHYAPLILYRPPRIEALHQWIVDVREKTGAKLIPATREGIRDLPDLLKSGKNVFILPDQEPSKGRGEFAPFFGEPALTMRLVSRLVKESGVPVMCLYGKRLSNGFEVVFQPAESGIYDEDLIASMTAMNKSIENCVLDIPEQYQWSYKRFKTRPKGEPKLYRF